MHSGHNRSQAPVKVLPLPLALKSPNLCFFQVGLSTLYTTLQALQKEQYTLNYHCCPHHLNCGHPQHEPLNHYSVLVVQIV